MAIKFNKQDLSNENFIDVLNEVLKFFDSKANENATAKDGAIDGALRSAIYSYNQRVEDLKVKKPKK